MNHWTQDKMMLMVSAIIGSSATYLGAIMSEGEARWLLVSFGSAMLASVMLAIGFRKPHETTRIVIGRCFIAIMVGVSITKTALHYWKLDWLDKDIVALLLASNGATTFGYLIGYEVLLLINQDSGSISKWIYNWLVKKLGPP
jgi:hypothetical protein